MMNPEEVEPRTGEQIIKKKSYTNLIQVAEHFKESVLLVLLSNRTKYCSYVTLVMLSGLVFETLHIMCTNFPDLARSGSTLLVFYDLMSLSLYVPSPTWQVFVSGTSEVFRVANL